MKSQRKQRLNNIRRDMEIRMDILDQKYKNDKVKAKDRKSSLPLISGSKASNTFLLKTPGE